MDTAAGSYPISTMRMSISSREAHRSPASNFATQRAHPSFAIVSQLSRTAAPKASGFSAATGITKTGNPLSCPRHQLIDRVTPDNPVFVNRLDGHMALANAAAMKLAGIAKAPRMFPAAMIVRDTEGNPTGIFKDAAQSLIERVSRRPPGNRSSAQSGPPSNTRFRTASPACRICRLRPMSFAPISPFCVAASCTSAFRPPAALPVAAPGRPGIQADFGNDALHIGGLKGFADGSLGSTTAWFFQPYLDALNTSGIASDELLHPDTMHATSRGAEPPACRSRFMPSATAPTTRS